MFFCQLNQNCQHPMTPTNQYKFLNRIFWSSRWGGRWSALFSRKHFWTRLFMIAKNRALTPKTWTPAALIWTFCLTISPNRRTTPFWFSNPDSNVEIWGELSSVQSTNTIWFWTQTTILMGTPSGTSSQLQTQGRMSNIASISSICSNLIACTMLAWSQWSTPKGMRMPRIWGGTEMEQIFATTLRTSKERITLATTVVCLLLWNSSVVFPYMQMI